MSGVFFVLVVARRERTPSPPASSSRTSSFDARIARGLFGACLQRRVLTRRAATSIRRHGFVERREVMGVSGIETVEFVIVERGTNDTFR